MKMYVTGGTGFIGRRVVAELKRRKHAVRLLSARLSDTAKIKSEVMRFNPDCVIHLAWEGLPDYGPQMSVKNAIQGLKLLNLLASLKIKKIVAAGSCFEYDDKETKHFSFTLAKRMIHGFGKEMFSESGTVFVWAVPFFVYGAGKPRQSLIPSLIEQARRGEIPTAKHADTWHDFVYVDDVARAVVLLAEKNVSAGTYDIGTGKLTRTGEIAQMIARAYNFMPKGLRRVRKAGRPANIQSLKNATGWKPEFSISKGIATTIKEYG